MGTSSSSKGSPSNVPMVPPWVPDAPGTPPGDIPSDDNSSGDVPNEVSSIAAFAGGESSDGDAEVFSDNKARLAPPGRFGSARTNLTAFARYSDRAAMRRGVGHYVSQGYGGSGIATRRMGGAIHFSEVLFSALTGGPGNALQASGVELDPAVLAGRSADEVMDAITDAVRPVDGSQDAESSRAAIQDALAETLERFPDADLLNLTEEQKEYVTEVFVAGEIYGRLLLDVGTKVIENAPSTSAALVRLREIRDYIRETVAEAFRGLNERGVSLSKSRVSTVVSEAINDTFVVFEGYA